MRTFLILTYSTCCEDLVLGLRPWLRSGLRVGVRHVAAMVKVRFSGWRMHNVTEDPHKCKSTNVCVICGLQEVYFDWRAETLVDRCVCVAAWLTEGLRSHSHPHTPASCVICRNTFMHAHRHCIVVLYH